MAFKAHSSSVRIKGWRGQKDCEPGQAWGRALAFWLCWPWCLSTRMPAAGPQVLAGGQHY